MANQTSSTAQRTNRIAIIMAITGGLLLIPLIAMLFTDEVNWGLGDFVVMGILLLGTGLAYEFMSTKVQTKLQRLSVGAVLAAGFLLLWAELAVGIFGSPIAGS